jgi:cyclic pyranopterin phosphate synthase
MAEHMVFLPRKDLLTLEELDRIGSAFIRRGVRKLRITGGEPLVRRGVMDLFGSLSRHIGDALLDELTLTTNGTQLGRYAAELVRCGVRRVNVSVDTRNPDLFRRLTRGGDLAIVLSGIEVARAAGLSVKINVVALRGLNEFELPDLIAWAHGADMDMTLIETMPLGEVDADRTEHYLPLSEVRERLQARWTLMEIPERTGGPARYVRVAETGGKLGFITPLTHNFCDGCNRVRLTCTGTLFTCLGHENSVDLRAVVRSSRDDAVLDEAIDRAVAAKPKGHDFVIARGRGPVLSRHMSMTGG